MMQALPPDPSPQALARLHEMAADWFVRRQQTGWTGADERALNDWLEQSPLHREILDGMARRWQQAPQLKALFPETFGTTAPAAAAPVERPLPTAPRRRFLPALASGLLALVLVAALGGWYRWEHTASYTLQARTAPGETRELQLPDGSRVALNIDSRLSVRYYPRRRELVLEQGEAFFKVAADSDRPFTVDAGSSQVRVVGTAFNVRAGPPRLVVKVLEGVVQLRADRDRPDAEVLRLAAGAGMAIDTATGQRHGVPAEADTVGDWRTGQVRFSGAPLAEVAQELARYIGAPVLLEDPALGQLRVSGLLATHAPERFLRALPSLIPVRVQPREGGGWLLRKG
ncbi:FecR family protein [Variovorax boronicumulans]|uniref:FecR family protein n=1 Tax=Variovorax boronicumulans TaxID=436515 RepID=UPI001C5910F3